MRSKTSLDLYRDFTAVSHSFIPIPSHPIPSYWSIHIWTGGSIAIAPPRRKATTDEGEDDRERASPDNNRSLQPACTYAVVELGWADD
jgi:hypothetical protein